MVVELPEALSGVVEELCEDFLDVIQDGPDVFLCRSDINSQCLLSLELGLEIGVILGNLSGTLINRQIQIRDIVPNGLDFLQSLLLAVLQLVNGLKDLIDLALLSLC